MAVDMLLSEFSVHTNEFKVDNNFIFAKFDQSLILLNDLNIKDTAPSRTSMDPPILSSDLELSNVASSSSLASKGDLSDETEFSDAVLKYINQILMEEDIGEKSCMFQDPLALQAAERPFYELLGQDYPLSIGSPENSFYELFGQDYPLPIENLECSSDKPNNSSSQSLPAENICQSSLQSDSHCLSRSHTNVGNTINLAEDSSASPLAVQNIFSNGVSAEFNKGVDEATEFLPKGNPFCFDFESHALTSKLKKEAVKLVANMEKDEREHSPGKSRGRKNQHLEDIEVDGRSNKQSAVYMEEDELLDMFDKVHVISVDKHRPLPFTGDETNALQKNEHSSGFHGVRTRSRKRVSKKEVVDLRTLLIQCAKAVSVDDRRTANEQLKEVRQYSSALGDANQRLAHYFADALEARLAGTGSQIYTAPKKNFAADVLKAYRNCLEKCPFKEISVIFANHMILKEAEKAQTLHVIDFGILYGFQWPILIQRLSTRAGCPPKLRITGIELPLSGFRPAERVEETGRRLARYCEQFNVPFEYNAIAQKWETIRIEDLKIGKDEVLVVNCMYRLENLLDETIVLRSPRNAVLKLIRKTKPNLFVHAVLNASYNSPFFLTRFKEALFNFATVLDMQDSITTREDQERLTFEKEFYARTILNVIACEGTERIQRPESYKQWAARNRRAGFIQVELEKELMKKLKDRMKAYHQDFVIDEDGGWVLVGWKGRITCATTCWVPA